MYRGGPAVNGLVEEVLHRELVICDNAAIDLLAQPAEFLDNLGASAA